MDDILNTMRVTAFFVSIAAVSATSRADDIPVPPPLEEVPHVELEMTWPTKANESDLKAFREPGLAERTKRPFSEEIRFVWMRFDAPPVAIRAFSDETRAKLRVVRLDGKSGFELGRIDLDKTVELAQENWAALKSLTEKPKARNPLKGMTILQKHRLCRSNRSWWTLEVRKGKSYSHEGVPSPLSLIALLGKEDELGDDFVLPDLREFADVCKRLLALAKSAEPELFADEDLY